MYIDGSGNLNISALTASQIVATDASKNIVTLTTATYPSLTELSYVKGVTSAIQTQLTAKLSGAIDEFMSMSTYQSSSSVNNTTYYFLKEAMFDQVVTGIEVFVDSAGASNGIDIALYDAAGSTLLASKATPLASFSSGKVRVPFDAPYTVVKGTLYWQGFGNANGGSATFVIGPTAINSSSFARVDAGVPTCGATLPTGSSTNARLAWNWY
jgi:hypothetical protein